MTPQQQRDLTDLREAAHNRDQQQLQLMLKRLLQSMDFFVALAVPLEVTYRFLDIFESYYPDEIWPRQLLLAITSFGTTPDDSIAETALQQDFSEPGAGNFLKAVYDITQAMNDMHTTEARIGFMTSAAVNAIMAELVEAWYGEHLEAWQRVRENTYNPETDIYSDPGATDIAYQFWTDRQTAALDVTAWLQIANSIEKKLTRFEHENSATPEDNA